MATDDDNLQKVLRDLVDKCKSHLNAQAEGRQLALSYYDGKMTDVDPQDSEQDRTTSKVVSMDVRSTVRKLMPAVMRTLFASDRMVEYVPQGPEDVQNAESATAYVNKVLMNRCGARDAIYDAVFDAMVVKTGILHACVVKERRTVVCDYSSQAPEFLEQASQMGEVTDVEQDPDGTVSFSLVKREAKAEVRMEAIPREQFLIHPDADDVPSSPIVGHVQYTTRSDLVAMGYDKDLVYRANLYENRADDEFSDRYERRGDDYGSEDGNDDMNRSQETVLTYFAYVKVDLDGDGISELYKFVMVEGSLDDDYEEDVSRRGSTDYIILERELVNEAPYFPVVVEREAHSFEGHSLAEEAMEVQRINTALLRETLNNIYAVNSPQLFVDESKVEDTEALYNRQFNVPVLVRNSAKVPDIMQFSEVPYVGDKNLMVMEHLNKTLKEATGVTDASGGADPNKMEHMAATTASILSDAALAQSEMMIRTLKMGGIRDAFRYLYRLVINHVGQEEVLMVDGNAMTFSPSAWPADMDCVVNTGLGTGAREREINNLMMVMEQMKLLGEMGFSLFMNEQSMFRYLSKMVEAIGYTDVNQFFHMPSPEEVDAWKQELPMEIQLEQMKMQGQAQMKEQELQAKAQMDRMELEHKAQMDAVKAEMDAKLKQSEADSKIAIEHAQMQADLAVDAAKTQNEFQLEMLKEQHQMGIENMKLEMAREIESMKLMFEERMEEMKMRHELAMKKMELELQREEAQKDRESQEKMAKEGNASKETIAEGKNND